MHGTMKVCDTSGHTTHRWDSDVPAEVAAARATFDAMTGKGYSAFRVDDRGERSTRITAFDPDAEEMILIPQLKGG